MVQPLQCILYESSRGTYSDTISSDFVFNSFTEGMIVDSPPSEIPFIHLTLVASSLQSPLSV